ncbi:MAG: BrnA antitoxin family protein [Steroidobacteraceae bacterium]
MKRATTSRKSQTDLRRVRQLTDSKVVRDDDAPEWSPAMFASAVARKGLRPVPKKTLLSLRIDADVINWFKAQGSGYQSRMNALLRAFMEAHK